jgi:hypothetical protein
VKFEVNVPFELSRTSRIAGLAACLSLTSVATLAQQPQTPPPAATPSGQPATAAYSYDPQDVRIRLSACSVVAKTRGRRRFGHRDWRVS